MKKFIIALLFSASVISHSQVRIGDFRIEQYGHGKISKSALSDFKNSKTYFVIDDKLGLNKDDFNSILKDTWTITPFEVVLKKERSKYLNEGNSLVFFDSFRITKEKDFVQTSVHSFTVFDVFMPENIKKRKNGKYKYKRNRVAALYFTIDVSARKDVVNQEGVIKGDIFNYRKGYLKNAFQNINKGLNDKNNIDIYDDFTNKTKVNALKNKTLYFSDDLIYGYNAWTVGKQESITEEELFKDYKFDYKIVSDDDLNKMILDDSQEHFYYLLYSQINSNKILNIIDSKTGEIIFQEHKKMSFNLKSKDLKQLSNTISKAK